LRAASLSFRRWAASRLRLLNWATLPWTSELPREWVRKGLFWREGREGDWGSCCRFARSGETGKRGVPGEAGKRKTGSMWTMEVCRGLVSSEDAPL